MANLDPPIYDVKIGDATGASSAAPTFFDPRVNTNHYDFTELQIDGALVANNPGFYAYEMSRVLKGKKKIRVLSLGTGEKPFKPVTDSKSFDIFDIVAKKDEFLMNMDVYTAHNWMKDFMWPGTYLRLQVIT